MSKLKAKNTLYNDPMYDVVVDSRMLEQYLKEKDQQIADLETKLAEKEIDIIILDTENYSIKQQIDSLRQQLAEMQNEKAIRELEKLKKEMFEGKCQMWFNIATNEYVINHRDKSIIDYIDKRINELRGGK